MTKALIVKKLVLVALPLVAGLWDRQTTKRWQKMDAGEPPAGVYYIGTDGLQHISRGQAHEILPWMGNGSLPLIMDDSVMVAIWQLWKPAALGKFNKASTALDLAVTAEHGAFALHNLTLGPYQVPAVKILPTPAVCTIEHPCP